MDDYLESDIIKATICSAACVGIKLGPMSPGTGMNWLYLSMGEHDGFMGEWSFHKGGNGGFTQVLARAATAYGAEIRLDSHVSSLITEASVPSTRLSRSIQKTFGVSVSSTNNRLRT